MIRCLLLCLVLFLSATAFSQTIFAPQGATWQFTRHITYHSGRASGYTIVDGKSCTIILLNEHDYHQNSYSRGMRTTYASGDTVYYLRFPNRLVPLYIFNVQEGDTIPFYKSYIPSGTDSFFHVRIDSVRLVSWGAVPLKTVYARTIDNSGPGSLGDGFGPKGIPEAQFYVERLGCINCDGLIPWASVMVPECICDISCYYDGITDIRLYTDSCNGTRLKLRDSGKLDFRIAPNPSNGTVKIQLSRPLPEPASMSVFDISGRKCYAQMISTGQQEFLIPSQSWPPGKYVIIFYSPMHMYHSFTKN